MAKSSIHIKKAHIGFILHSVRANKSNSVVFIDEENEYFYTKEKALKLFRDELKKREIAYTKKTGKKLPKNTATLLSAVVNLEQKHTLKDLEPIINYLEKQLDVKVVSAAIHRDEGKLIDKITKAEYYSGEDFILNEDGRLYWIDENHNLTEPVNMDEFEIKKNYHAHIEFTGLDSNGVAVKRNKLHKYFLSNLQTFVADTLKMERGFNYYQTNTKAPKRKDVREFKKEGVAKRKGATAVLARVKDLKEINKQLRAELKQLGGKREDYAILEAFVKDLKEEIKQRNLTIQELNNRIEQYKKDVFSNFTYKNTNKPVKYKYLAEFYKNELNKASQDKKKLLDRVKVLQEKKNALKRSNEKLELLEEKNKQLEEELKRYRAYSFAFNKINIFQVKVTVTRQKIDKNPFEYAEDAKYIEIIANMAKVDVVDFEIQKNEKGSIEAVRVETKTGTIFDTGDEITLKTASIGDDYLLALKQNAKLMVQIAISKGWDLKSVKIEGSKAFKKAIEDAIKTWLGPDDYDYDNDISWNRGGLGF